MSSSKTATIAERVSEDASDASPLGYSRAKWVAERLCSDANDQIASSRGRRSISIIRIGQLCGDETGVWNTSEAYPLLLSTASIVGCLPDLPHQVIDWIPVHQAAQAVLDISLRNHDGTVTNGDGSEFEPSSQNVTTPVYHVLNPDRSTSWQQMLQWAAEESVNNPFTVVSPAVWLERLEAMPGHHPSLRLLGLWKDAFDAEKLSESDKSEPVFEVSLAQEASEAMRCVKPLDRQSVVRMWRWIGENIREAQGQAAC